MASATLIVNYSLMANKDIEVHHQGIQEELGLSERAIKVAEEELREDENIRRDSLHQMREWIQKNEDLKNIRLDSKFLLRFLRVKKFSVPMAQQILLKYLNLKRVFPEPFINLDFMSSKQYDIISQGYIFPSPFRDRAGRRVIIMNLGNFDPKKFTCMDMATAHFILYETLLSDPENQVLGLVHAVNVSGMSPALITIWNPTEFARLIKWGEQSMPLRFKEFSIVHLPASLKWILDFIKTRLSAKMKSRFFTHSTIDDLHKKIEPHVLPQELGGTMPMNDMIELWKKELASNRDLLLALNKMKLLSDRGIIKRNNNNNNNNNGSKELESLNGSFRKLEFD